MAARFEREIWGQKRSPSMARSASALTMVALSSNSWLERWVRLLIAELLVMGTSEVPLMRSVRAGSASESLVLGPCATRLRRGRRGRFLCFCADRFSAGPQCGSVFLPPQRLEHAGIIHERDR